MTAPDIRQFHRAAGSMANGLLTSRWPALIERYREQLCFCADCEAVRAAGIDWVGHADVCGVHGNSFWRCLECDALFAIPDCRCGHGGMSIDHRRVLSRRVPAFLAGLVARVRTVLGSRLRRHYLNLRFSIVQAARTFWRRPRQTDRKPHPCFRGCARTSPVPSGELPARSCTAPRVFFELLRSRNPVE